MLWGFYSVRRWCVGLTVAACLLGSGLPVSADEIYVRNRPFKRVVYVDSSLYAPLKQFVQALHMGMSVSENGRLLFDSEPVVNTEKMFVSREQNWAVQEVKFLEAEYGGVVFPITYIWHDNEIWVPIRLLAERLGFTVKENKSTGIIDIIAPRPISWEDRLAAETLKAEKSAQVERAEQILAARRAEKIKRQKEEAEQAKKAAAQKKKAASEITNNIRRKRVTYSAEGDFPSEFDNDAALAGVAPRRNSRTHLSAEAVKTTTKDASEGSYPKAKPRPKKKAPVKAAPAPKTVESGSVAKDVAQKQDPSQDKAVQAVPFISYSSPQVSANYGDGSIEYSVCIFNRSKADAKKASVILSVVDSNGTKIITKSEELGTVRAGENKTITGKGRHPLRSSIPRISYYLEVELNWEGR